MNIVMEIHERNYSTVKYYNMYIFFIFSVNFISNYFKIHTSFFKKITFFQNKVANIINVKERTTQNTEAQRSRIDSITISLL